MNVTITKHPQWIVEFLEEIHSYEQKIVDGNCFSNMASGNLSIENFREIMVNFIPLIENFPKYMALILAKVPSGNTAENNLARTWLIKNINIERMHADWYRDWIKAFGVSNEVADAEFFPCSEVDGINNYLWRICTYGSLAEAVAALNFAVEGPTGIWTKRVYENINSYRNRKGVNLTKRSLAWIKGHAHYDDHHPDEALELIKAFATTPEEQEKVSRAAKTGMAYYALAAETSYEMNK